ncbi:tyrosine-protein phosphatase non-receptor type 9-like [Sycon ciliatum]|uniref:tyrosine-protein phosphatase non-receptor type 9-like n=1 Tax=Sycon ciliatum TaxID=27933 RepID=UPI0020A96719|eukprot:scpid25048/ scgid17001/ Tyrosine-protein phosphatase non-receptor type 9; Protein-tyrosine phosphatase MEG2
MASSSGGTHYAYGSKKYPTLILPDGKVAGPVRPRRDQAAMEPMDLVQVEEELLHMMTIPEAFLTAEEEDVLEEFCGDIARIRRLNDRDATREYAVKFLMARKFNPSRAFDLYQRYKMIRHKYEMDKLVPNEDPLYSELATGKFTFLEGAENGEAIGIFTGALHGQQTDVRLLLQGLLFNIDEALRSFATVACGITILVNLRGMKPTKNDREMAETIMSLLQDQYPARIKHIFVIDAPWYMRRLFRLISPFLKAKMRERVQMVRVQELLDHFPRKTLPVSLGGTRLPNHGNWLTRAINHYMYMKGSRPYAGNHMAFERRGLMSAGRTAFRRAGSPLSSARLTKPRSASLVDSCITESANRRATTDGVGESRMVGGAAVNANLDPVGYLRAMHLMNGLTLEDIVTFMDPREYRDLFEEYSEIQAAPLHGRFMSTHQDCNSAKNRSADIFCMEDTRIKLNPMYLPNGEYAAGSDYIHANYVCGLHQPKTYILTQAPMESTFGDFWRMVWEQKLRVIVMAANLVENSLTKCFCYWPEANSIVRIADFSLRLAEVQQFQDWTRRIISIRRGNSSSTRNITHYQLTSWSDRGPVKNSMPMLQVMLDMHHKNDVIDPTMTPNRSREAIAAVGPTMSAGPNCMEVPTSRMPFRSLPDASELEAAPMDEKRSKLEEGNKTAIYPPILVHCCTGVGRSAAFVAADICCIAIMQGMADVAGTVCFLRTQRAQSVQTLAQYKFIYQAVVQYGRLLQDAESESEMWQKLLEDMPTSHSSVWGSSSASSVLPESGSTITEYSRQAAAAAPDGDSSSPVKSNQDQVSTGSTDSSASAPKQSVQPGRSSSPAAGSPCRASITSKTSSTAEQQVATEPVPEGPSSPASRPGSPASNKSCDAEKVSSDFQHTRLVSHSSDVFHPSSSELEENAIPN